MRDPIHRLTSAIRFRIAGKKLLNATFILTIGIAGWLPIAGLALDGVVILLSIRTIVLAV